MKKNHIRYLALMLVAFFVTTACADVGQPILPTTERVTFALVLNTRAYNGHKVIAQLQEDVDSAAKETIEGVLEDYPNTAIQSWAKMTTLEKIWTNQRYFLDFYIDLDDDGTRSAGDLEGIQHFDVSSSAVWTETKYYASELTIVSDRFAG